MSLIKTIRQQLGLSVTPANNFTLDASADNGTMKLARGNAGATTQDIMTVDASGKVDFAQLARSLSGTGYYTLPGGLIIQWGNSATVAGSVTLSWPLAFPNAVFTAVGCGQNANNVVVINAATNTQGVFYQHLGNTGVAVSDGFRWIAVGR